MFVYHTAKLGICSYKSCLVWPRLDKPMVARILMIAWNLLLDELIVGNIPPLRVTRL